MLVCNQEIRRECAPFRQDKIRCRRPTKFLNNIANLYRYKLAMLLTGVPERGTVMLCMIHASDET